MASIIKTAGGYRAMLCINRHREERRFRTRAEACGWAARREAEIRMQADGRLGEVKTLADAIERYLAEVSIGHRGQAKERVRLGRIVRERELPVHIPLSRLTAQHITAWRDARLKALAASA